MTSISARMDSCQLTKLKVESLAPQGPDADLDVRVLLAGHVATAPERDNVRKLTIDLDLSNEDSLFYRVEATAEAIFSFDEAYDSDAIMTYLQGEGWRMAMSSIRAMLDSVTALFPNGTLGLPDTGPARRIDASEVPDEER